MKTPITYYGGKVTMLPHILPLIPEHTIYCEPFFGGGAVFWAKEPAEVEIINDLNDQVINFYKIMKTDFENLKTLVEGTLHSRTTYKSAMAIYQTPHLFTALQQAWAFYVLTNQGFACIIGSWGFGRTKAKVRAFHNKKLRFQENLAQRLENVQLESNDAIKVIESRDTEHTFHYIDPPYVGADQGHYAGYTEEQFKQLLDVLEKVKGKFLLSMYENEMLEEYTKRNGWHTKKINKPKTANNATGKRKRKIEVLTANYEI